MSIITKELEAGTLSYAAALEQVAAKIPIIGQAIEFGKALGNFQYTWANGYKEKMVYDDQSAAREQRGKDYSAAMQGLGLLSTASTNDMAGHLSDEEKLNKVLDARRDKLGEIARVLWNIGYGQQEQVQKMLNQTAFEIERAYDLDRAKLAEKAHQERLTQLQEENYLVSAQAQLMMDAQEESIKEAQKYSEQLASRVKGYVDAALTPLEKYQEKVAELQEMLSAGLIDTDIFDRSVSNALSEFKAGAGFGQTLKGVEAIERRMTFDIPAEQKKSDPFAKMTEIQKSTNSVAVKQERHLQRIADKLTKATDLVTVSLD